MLKLLQINFGKTIVLLLIIIILVPYVSATSFVKQFNPPATDVTPAGCEYKIEFFIPQILFPNLMDTIPVNFEMFPCDTDGFVYYKKISLTLAIFGLYIDSEEYVWNHYFQKDDDLGNKYYNHPQFKINHDFEVTADKDYSESIVYEISGSFVEVVSSKEVLVKITAQKKSGTVRFGKEIPKPVDKIENPIITEVSSSYSAYNRSAEVENSDSWIEEYGLVIIPLFISSLLLTIYFKTRKKVVVGEKRTKIDPKSKKYTRDRITRQFEEAHKKFKNKK